VSRRQPAADLHLSRLGDESSRRTAPLDVRSKAQEVSMRVEVVRPLDPELDEQAGIALRQWEFKPGTLDGKAVAVRISAELSFTLGK